MQVNIAGSYPVKVHSFYGKVNIYFSVGGPIYLASTLGELLQTNNGVNSGIVIAAGSTAEIAWSGDLWVACPSASPSAPVMVNFNYQTNPSLNTQSGSGGSHAGISRAFGLKRGGSSGTSIA